MEIELVVKLALLFLFLSVVVPAAVYSYNTYVYPFFKPEYKDMVPENTRNYVEAQFDAFVNNTNNCRISGNQNCACKDVFKANFPNNFPEGYVIRFQQKDDLIISLMYTKGINYEVKSEKVNNTFLGRGILDMGGTVTEEEITSHWYDIVSGYQTSTHTITFDKGKALWEGKKEIAYYNGLYKFSQSRLGIIFETGVSGAQLPDCKPAAAAGGTSQLPFEITNQNA